jgi:hypothetical protein
LEKISFLPLKQHLQDTFLFYNQLYADQELKSGRIDRVLLSRWIVEVIEPISQAAFQIDQQALPAVFRTFYGSLLRLLGNGQALTYEQQYRAAWSMTLQIPQLLTRDAKGILNAINSALIALRTYQPGRLDNWIELMQQTIPYCQNKDQFLNCGRFNAWLCGMAHLRSQALKLYPELPEQVKVVLNTLNLPLTAALKGTWIESDTLRFEGVAGGFSGFEGGFVRPPRVARIGGIVMATDQESSSALFADTLGKVLMKDIAVRPETIISQSSTTAFSAFQKLHGGTGIDDTDLTSCVQTDDGFVLTRSSSHYLFIYSCPNE